MADRLGLDAEFPGGNWLDRFRNDEGKIGGSENTLFRILQACPETAGAIAFNTRCGGLEARREGPWGDPGLWTSTMTATQVVYFQGLGIPASVKRLDTALAVFGNLNRFDPLLEYLNGLHWDGKPRINTWLVDYAKAANTAIVKFIGAKFLISMTARAVVPGCQVDHAMCLDGDQGIGKTQVARILGGQYMSEDLPNFHSRDAQQIACSHWVIEIGELAAVGQSKLERVKGFMTTASDTYVPKYERYPVTRKRWCVFIFTVNPDGAGYLTDTTGNRRIWPVKVGQVDAQALIRDRDQLFAEALHRYRAGEKWWPEGKLQWDELGEEQGARMVEEPWEPVIVKWLETRGTEPPLSTTEILTHALDLKPRDIEIRDAMRVGKTMKKLGYERYQKRDGEERGAWFYRKLPAPAPQGTPQNHHSYKPLPSPSNQPLPVVPGSSSSRRL
jgi:putative DNA primase/helicase